MKCEDVLQAFAAGRKNHATLEYQRAEAHLHNCEPCCNALRAVNVLAAERHVPVPPIERGAFERVVRAATQHSQGARHGRPGFWIGAAAGAALAAGVALAAVLVWPLARTPAPADTATVTAAVDEVHSVDLELDSPTALDGAEIRLVLDGAIELQGYEGHRELSWQADLDAGANQLSLPVVVRGPAGGQLRVVVSTGEGRRSFRVDVRSEGAESPEGAAPVGMREGTVRPAGRV